MLSNPTKSRAILRKAGSTALINYAEITLRMIPAIGLILAADISLYPLLFKLFGWFMFGTSLVLYTVPRKLHHAFANKCADILQPYFFLIFAPLSAAIGYFLIFEVW